MFMDQNESERIRVVVAVLRQSGYRACLEIAENNDGALIGVARTLLATLPKDRDEAIAALDLTEVTTEACQVLARARVYNNPAGYLRSVFRQRVTAALEDLAERATRKTSAKAHRAGDETDGDDDNKLRYDPSRDLSEQIPKAHRELAASRERAARAAAEPNIAPADVPRAFATIPRPDMHPKRWSRAPRRDGGSDGSGRPRRPDPTKLIAETEAAMELLEREAALGRLPVGVDVATERARLRDVLVRLRRMDPVSNGTREHEPQRGELFDGALFTIGNVLGPRREAMEEAMRDE